MKTKLRLTLVLPLFVGLVGVGVEAPLALAKDQSIGSLLFDDQLAQVASKVPGFAGFTVFEETETKIEMTVLSTRSDWGVVSQVQQGLREEFGHEFGATSFRISKVDYSFAQLKGWHDQLRAKVLSLPGVVHADLDEAKNRLSIGVETLTSSARAVEAEIARSGVPREGVIIEEIPPVVQELRSYRRPTLGGLQIQWYNFSDDRVYICSLGVHAVRRGVQGFVTNAHCSTTWEVSMDKNMINLCGAFSDST